jgi:valyl-tRNA synthetase
VENINWNWCLSRQRFYGIPFPVWHCRSCNEIIVATIEQLPIDPQETPYSGKCPQCARSDIVPDTDVMDTWNTSSLTPYICFNLFDNDKTNPFEEKNNSKFIPMGMRPQAHDIIRTWAFYTIVKTWMHNAMAPWKTIIISGHVLSDSKEKLSKSKENAKTNPDVLLNMYPADAIRYWTASGSLGQDIAFSEMQLAQGQRLITKLWNAFRFISEHTADIQLSSKPATFDAINEWILHQATKAFEKYKVYLDQHEFNLALDEAEKFFWHDVCDNYLELIKNQLFNPAHYTQEQVYATRWTLHTLGLRLLQLYAPYLPHITETLYQELYRPHLNVASIHQTRFTDIQQKFDYSESAQAIKHVLDVVAQVRKLKTEQKLSLKTPIQKLIIQYSDEKLKKIIENQELLIKGISQAITIEYEKTTTGTTHAQFINNELSISIVI